MKFFKNIGTSALVIILLIATSGVTLNKHYCMGRLKSVAVFENAKNCSGNSEADPMPCCEDVSQELKVEEITQVFFDFDSQPELMELATLELVCLNPAWSNHSAELQLLAYPPPLPDVNFQVTHQVFLI